MITKYERENIIENIRYSFCISKGIKCLNSEFIFDDTFEVKSQIIYSLKIEVNKEEFKNNFKDYNFSYLNFEENQYMISNQIPYYCLLQSVNFKDSILILKYFVIPTSLILFKDNIKIIEFARFLQKMGIEFIKDENEFLIKFIDNKYYIYMNKVMNFELMDKLYDIKMNKKDDYNYNLVNRNYNKSLLMNEYNHVYEIFI